MKKKKGVRKTSIKQAGKKIKSPAVVQNHTPYVVGIGASAGGLEALEKFFKNMPADSGMAFIVVTHLDPTHVSLLPELIQKTSQMQIHQAEDGMKIESNHVYVSPPNRDLAVLHNTIQLIEPIESHGFRLPIDFFFKSLAADKRNKAISIILSGMGSDGTSGLKAVKSELGLVIVQNPISAKFNNMPLSAIATGLVDYVLAPEDIPEQLLNYTYKRIRNFQIEKPFPEGKLPGPFQKIFVLLRTQTGHDFSLYKNNTIYRRVEKRMDINQIKNISDYVQFLQNNPREIESLFKELLIGVTNFFRDHESFDSLKRILLELLKKKPNNSQIRIWVPGCSTGEEAYSIAIILRECMEDIKQTFNVQIFATDIDNEAIEKARYGVFTGIAMDVGKERLNRYFTKDEDIYHIRKEIREMLIFAQQSLIKDPPFTKLDLISCRNLLIYMGPELQKKIIALFHFSLLKGGILFLGSSETISGFVDLFTLIEKKYKIYKRKDSLMSEQPMIDFPVSRAAIKPVEFVLKKNEIKNITQIAEKIILDNYSPNCVITNSKGEIIYIHGKAGKYLELARGEAKMNVLEMAREGLQQELSILIREVLSLKKPCGTEDIKIKVNGNYYLLNLVVKPINKPEALKGTLLIIFEEVTPKKKEPGRNKNSIDKKSGIIIKELESELKTSRENLRITIEELETSNEELKSANEELQSTNEELQSLNEEIETSKEELQSLNEELITINSELQNKNEELSVTNNDMKNLLDSIDIPTVFLDKNLCIKRFTVHATKLINLIGTDIGRPLEHMATKLKYDRLIEDTKQVLNTLELKEIEVQSIEGIWYLMRILPYRTINNVIDGVVITFLNINESK